MFRLLQFRSPTQVLDDTLSGRGPQFSVVHTVPTCSTF
ncbi:hypothetical protein C5167_022451 [Papaver somniferum]|uniref:Uncharacterized protein n=1 Tax=Papaver somniferum TaxID=3469 RepID=A0A4Y7JI04_PAPSO|nr:hypothetical protein C5167_022451 [Papaver somniferum]